MSDEAGIEQEMIPHTKQMLMAEPTAMNQNSNTDVNKKRIIKDGRIGIRVVDLEKTKQGVDLLLKNLDGYYSNERFNNYDHESLYNLTVRIPATSFEQFITELEKGNGEILYKEIDARDVTDQFIDLETRLQNKKNYLKRYNDLLNQAKNVKEILEIEEKVRVLEEEIDSTTGRLKYLSDLVNYSTLDLTISKLKDFKYNPETRDKYSERLKLSLSKGWFGFVDFSLFVIKIWPFWLIIAVILYFLKKFRARKKNKSL